MLNILNQCQDKNYIAYHTFYTPPRAQTSTIRYTSENNEEVSSDDELTDFMEGQPEATLFYLETPSNARELAEAIAKIALNQLKEKIKEKKTSLKYKKCNLKCSLKEHPYGSLRYCSTVIQKTPRHPQTPPDTTRHP